MKALSFIILLIILLIIIIGLYQKVQNKNIDNFGINYRYYKWEINEIKGGGDNFVQASEFTLYDINKRKINILNVSNPFGRNPFNETPSLLIDNNQTTKWLDFEFKNNGKSTLIFDLGNTNTVEPYYYSWTTANDAGPYSNRNPISWKIYLSHDNINWNLLNEIKGFNTPALNFTLVKQGTGVNDYFPLINAKENRYYKWEIIGKRVNNDNVQASEFTLYDNNQNKVKIFNVINPNGLNPINESPSKLIDGNVNTKWLDYNFINNRNKSTLIFDLGPSNTSIPYYYSWNTGNDFIDRDPTSWNIYKSGDAENWALLDSKNNFNTTTERFTLVRPTSNTFFSLIGSTTTITTTPMTTGTGTTTMTGTGTTTGTLTLTGTGTTITQAAQVTPPPVLLNLIPPTSKRFNFFKWEITKKRGNDSWIQVADFNFYTSNDPNSRITIPGDKVTNPNGKNPTNYNPYDAYWNQLPKNLVDNNVNNKWLDFNGPFQPPITMGGVIIFDFTSISSIPLYYSWTTADDVPNRDPISWTIYGSTDKISWTKLHEVSNFNTTSDRLKIVKMDSLNLFPLIYEQPIATTTPTFGITPNPIEYINHITTDKIGLLFLNPPEDLTNPDGVKYGYRVKYDCTDTINNDNCKYDYKY